MSESENEAPQSSTAGPNGAPGPDGLTTTATENYQERSFFGGNDPEKAKREEKKHEKEEHYAGATALAASAYAMHEGHKAKTDPDHYLRHKLEEEVAAGLGVMAGGLAVFEHHEKKESKEEMEEHKKHSHHHDHGFFG